MTTYTRVPNDLFEKLCMSHLSSADIKVILAIIRYTYGFNRNEAELSTSFIAQKTDLSPTWVKSTINKLIENSVIFARQCPTNKNARLLSINSQIGQLYLTDNGQQYFTDPLTGNGQSDFTDNGQPYLTQENKYINKTINKTNKTSPQKSFSSFDKENSNCTFDPEEFFKAAVEKSKKDFLKPLDKT